MQFTNSMEAIITPLSLKPEKSVEPVHPTAISLTSLEGPLVFITIFVQSSPSAMRKRAHPVANVLNYIIIFLGLIAKGSFTVELTLPKLTLVPAPIGKLVDSVAMLLVVEPITGIGVPIGPVVGAVSVLQLVAEISLVLVAVAKINSLLHGCLI